MTEEFLDENTKKAMEGISQSYKQIQELAKSSIPKIDHELFKPSVDLVNVFSNQIQLSDKFKELYKDNKMPKLVDLEQPHIDFSKIQSNFELPEDFVPIESVMVQLQTEMNDSLKKIVDNTSVLTQMMEISQSTSEDTKEQTIILHNILDILSSKSEEEAKSKFAKVIESISKLGEHANNFSTLINLANVFYQGFVNKQP